MQFIKLGGSLITDKDQAHTPRLDRIDAISAQIAGYIHENPQEKIVLGHGSGSFGHIPARKFDTRNGVKTPADWDGFHQVWQEARALNLLVMDALMKQGVRAVSFAPSGSVTPSSSSILAWNIEPIRSALGHGMTPVVFGDVVFDLALGGTILSTEELFIYLAKKLQPTRILLAGIEAGVWEDYPDCTRLVNQITPTSFPALRDRIKHSNSPDVTGGMLSKVESMVGLIQNLPDLQVDIFSGVAPEAIYKALCGLSEGTTIKAG
jgi:isopentenyl phosphate kinase